jgi:hypothetical protein
MSEDITGILKNWKHDSENNIRITSGDDGREILQVRLPLGIEQYELTGRPDGKKPFGKLTVLEEFSERLKDHIKNHATDKGFHLNHDEILMLQNEAVLYYLRYLLLFQLGEYERTVQDTHHNLQVCELVEKYCNNDEDKKAILQYKPYILRMNAISRAMLSNQHDIKIMARQILESAIDEIRHMPEIETSAFKYEKVRSINYLKSAIKQLNENDEEPESLKKLQIELNKAVEYEEYESAAELRDKIKQFNQKKRPEGS